MQFWFMPFCQEICLRKFYSQGLVSISVNLLSPGAVPQQEPFAFLFEQRDDGLHYKHQFFGSLNVKVWLDALTDARRLEIEGDEDLLNHMLDGDMVVSAQANTEQLLPHIAELLSTELQVPVELRFETVERPVFVITGEFQCEAKTPDDMLQGDQQPVKKPHVILHDGTTEE